MAPKGLKRKMRTIYPSDEDDAYVYRMVGEMRCTYSSAVQRMIRYHREAHGMGGTTAKFPVEYYEGQQLPIGPQPCPCPVCGSEDVIDAGISFACNACRMGSYLEKRKDGSRWIEIINVPKVVPS